MTDILVPMPSSWRYLDQFQPSQWAPSPSLYRCACACVAMATEFARPGSHIPEHLEDVLYVKYDGPDVASDTQGTTFASLEAMFAFVQVGIVNLQSLIDQAAASNNVAMLHAELQAQNQQKTPQVITINNMAQLADNNGKPLYS